MNQKGFSVIMAVIGIGFLLGVFAISTKYEKIGVSASPSPALSPVSVQASPMVSETPVIDASYTLEYSEGTCSEDTDCAWAGRGCGGGHGKCTNDPLKYAGSASTCEINPDFPANQGYSCGCVASLNKCGWKK